MTARIRYAPLVACAMLLLAGSAQAAYPPQSATGEAPARETFKPDRSPEEVGQSYCPTGMQRFVPGSYYYCMGRRELAKGNHARSMAALIEAARWGSKQAQFLLGVGYFKGDNPRQDRARGLAWLGLAAERGDVLYLGVLKSAMAQATDEEKARASQLYTELLGSYGDDVAAVRAERRYRRERDQLVRGDVYGAEICIDGLNATRPPTARADDPDQTFCPSRLPVALVARQVDESAEEVLRGWAGHVTVGEPRKVPAPGQ
ncbi:SEL1-like repeat protein [Dyella telluris]|uniref:SEL1-like repeat protein n=1 Tax=Dyella telluris TaxID=2763498 RepID=A0A7G8PZH4_9GAMM|nr:SEL1-like repeat protein [Dyella telluris]QNJ99931.1 SEL1-like repeat protein [Dyella telluris]